MGKSGILCNYYRERDSDTGGVLILEESVCPGDRGYQFHEFCLLTVKWEMEIVDVQVSNVWWLVSNNNNNNDNDDNNDNNNNDEGNDNNDDNNDNNNDNNNDDNDNDEYNNNNDNNDDNNDNDNNKQRQQRQR